MGSFVSSSASLLELHAIAEYCQGTIKELSQLINQEVDSLFCARGQGIIDNADDLSFYIIAQQGFSSTLANQKLDTLNDEHISQQVKTCFTQKSHQYFDDSLYLYLASGGYRAVVYLALAHPLSAVKKQLLDVFLSGVSIGYENVHLFQKLNNAAYKDWLTSLPNRLEFVRFLDDFAKGDCASEVAALIDINHFSDVNDALGQDIGNQLLEAVAQRLQSLSKHGKIARVGADVFGVIGSEEHITPASLMALFEQPFTAGEQKLPINACLGFCSAEHANTSGVKVLNQIKNQVDFQSHSVTHPMMTSLDNNELKTEFENSKIDLEKELKNKISYFSYPIGDYNDHVAEIAKKYYTAAFAVGDQLVETKKINTPSYRYELPRINITDNSIYEIFFRINGFHSLITKK